MPKFQSYLDDFDKAVRAHDSKKEGEAKCAYLNQLKRLEMQAWDLKWRILDLEYFLKETMKDTYYNGEPTPSNRYYRRVPYD